MKYPQVFSSLYAVDQLLAASQASLKPNPELVARAAAR